MLTISEEAAIAELALWAEKNNSLEHLYNIMPCSSGLMLVIYQYASNLPVRVGGGMYSSYESALGAYGQLIDKLRTTIH